MAFDVLLTQAAERDLEELFDYIALHDAPENAAYVLGQIEQMFFGLAELPECGTIPKELQMLGLKEFREVFFKPYRIIYRILDKHIYVLLIVDGRWDMQSLLQRRLLES